MVRYFQQTREIEAYFISRLDIIFVSSMCTAAHTAMNRFILLFFFQTVNSSLNISDFLFHPNSCRKILLDGCLSYRDRRPDFVCKFSTLGVLLISSSRNVSGLQTQIGQILVSGPGWGFCSIWWVAGMAEHSSEDALQCWQRGFQSRHQLHGTQRMKRFSDGRMYLPPAGI